MTTLAAPPTETVTYHHTDGLGSPIARTNEAGGLVSKTRYEPYGMTVDGTTPPDIGFTGHVNDVDTGLTYMQQRYYDPVAGRMLSLDPVTTDANAGGSFNRYAYALNSPYKNVDPDGRNPALASRLIYAVAFRAATEAGAATVGSLIGIAIYDAIHKSDSNAVASVPEGKKDTLKPGDHAGESIPARGPDRNFNQGERDKMNEIGGATGCHTCGSTEAGTSSGNFVPDHQPPNALNPTGGAQELYPHCLDCSRTQGGQVRGEQTRKPKPPEPQETPKEPSKN